MIDRTLPNRGGSFIRDPETGELSPNTGKAPKPKNTGRKRKRSKSDEKSAETESSNPGGTPDTDNGNSPEGAGV